MGFLRHREIVIRQPSSRRYGVDRGLTPTLERRRPWLQYGGLYGHERSQDAGRFPPGKNHVYVHHRKERGDRIEITSYHRDIIIENKRNAFIFDGFIGRIQQT